MARNECDYCEVDDIKLALGDQWTSGAKHDRSLEHAIEEASRLIDLELGWGDCHCAARDSTPTARYFDSLSGLEAEIDRCLDGAYYAANSITFTLLGSTITDTANGLAVFLTGDVILISGSVSNDGTYIITTGGVAGTIVVAEALVGEPAGAVVSITTFRVEVDETETGVYVTWIKGTDFIVWPYNNDWLARLVIKTGATKIFSEGQQTLRITARWGGYRIPPAVIRKAAIIMVAKAFKRGMQLYQDTGAIEELGQLKYVLAIDPEVEEILKIVPRRVNFG